MDNHLSANSDDYILKNFENSYLKPFANKIPSKVQTWHLTYMTMVWSLVVILFGYLMQYSRLYIIGISICVLLQYLTDVFDGELGRVRKTGLVKWGYYMDHLLDFAFVTSLYVAYRLGIPHNTYFLSLAYIIFLTYMIHSFLYAAIDGRLHISYYKIGPSEMRILLIIANILYMLSLDTFLAYASSLLMLILSICLFNTIFNSQSRLRKHELK